MALADGPPHPYAHSAAIAATITIAAAVILVTRASSALPKTIKLGLTGAAAMALLALLLLGVGGLLATNALLALAILLFARKNPFTLGEWARPWIENPERLLIATFAVLAFLGTLALALPQSAQREAIPIADAAFTAVSAVCVTGLAVRDTATEFSPLGQTIILLLIQLGGLGIMTFSTAAIPILGRRMSLRHERAIASLISVEDRGQLTHAARRVLAVTFSIEAAGALALLVAFLLEGDSFPQAAWRAAFTSISAFCNAGFALQPDSLVSYQQSPLVLHTIAALIIAGGLSPAVIVSMPFLARRKTSAEAKLSLLAAAFLLAAGAILFLSFEWSGSLRHLTIPQRIHNAWLQSATLRTAGFNSIDLAQTRPATITAMIAFMFIGGGPGSTAGGIKTTTAALLALAAFNAIRGRPAVVIFRRRIPPRTIRRATTIALVAGAGSVLALIALQLTQDLPLQIAAFEVVSALATVGLTIGGTAELDAVGKIIIIACMFAGRVGTLSLLSALGRELKQNPITWPDENINVG